MEFIRKQIGHILRMHVLFWMAALAWISFVGIFWYWLFSGALTFIKVPHGESGYTFGYFIGALGVGAIAIVLAGRRTHTLMEQVENDRSKVENDRAKTINENFTKSIELLGGEAVTVRQGGIYALQRQLREADLYPTIFRIVSAFVRDKSRQFQREQTSEDTTLPVDVEAALIVIRDRKTSDPHSYENKKIASRKPGDSYLFDLSNSYLLNIDLNEIDFRYWNLSDSKIVGCSLQRAKIEGANFSSSSFQDVDFTGVDFSKAILNDGVTFEKCTLSGVVGMTNEQLQKANVGGHG